MNRALLETPFDPGQIKQREGSFGQTLDYVEAPAIIRRLNDAFEAAWSFEVLKFEVHHDEVVVLGRITADGIVKTQFGSSKISRAKSTGAAVSLGDDLKAAATDALKKAPTFLGVGLHLYEDTTPAHTQETPAQVPASQPRGSGNGRTGLNPGLGGPRLSPKQHKFIVSLLGESGVTRSEVNRYCQERFGLVLDHLSKQAASQLIDALMNDQVPTGSGAGNRQAA